MEIYMWLILASMLVVGVGIGFVIGRNGNNQADKIKGLEQALEMSKQEKEAYRSQVVDHFGKTAVLFNQLTNDYRAVHQHLVASSQSLCGDQVPKLTGSVPEAGFLEAEAVVTEQQTKPSIQTQETAETASASEAHAASTGTSAVSDEDLAAASLKEEAETSGLEQKTAEARMVH